MWARLFLPSLRVPSLYVPLRLSHPTLVVIGRAPAPIVGVPRTCRSVSTLTTRSIVRSALPQTRRGAILCRAQPVRSFGSRAGSWPERAARFINQNPILRWVVGAIVFISIAGFLFIKIVFFVTAAIAIGIAILLFRAYRRMFPGRMLAELGSVGGAGPTMSLWEAMKTFVQGLRHKIGLARHLSVLEERIVSLVETDMRGYMRGNSRLRARFGDQYQTTEGDMTLKDMGFNIQQLGPGTEPFIQGAQVESVVAYMVRSEEARGVRRCCLFDCTA